MKHGFWDFTLKFYGGEGVSEALVRLQDECGLDVNVLLYAIWRGLAGQALAAGDARAAEAAIAIWRSQVTEPLRDLRRRLKQAEWTGLPAGLRARAEGAFREQVKAAELESEQLTQAVLEALPACAAGGTGTVAANLAAVRSALAPAAAQAEAARLCSVLERASAAYSASASG